jgi:uncharacterized protein YecT (DUF1311 family)
MLKNRKERSSRRKAVPFHTAFPAPLILIAIGIITFFACVFIFIMPGRTIALDCPGSPASAAHDCLASELLLLDKELQAAYSGLLESAPVNDPNLADVAREMLRESQQAWIVFRKAHCAYRGFIEGGVPGYKTVYEDECLIALTKSRINEFKLLRKDYE